MKATQSAGASSGGWQAERREWRDILWLAAPLVVVYAGNQCMSIVDTAVIGRLGSKPLAGASLASSLFFVVATLGMGVMMGLDPIASQAVGAGRSEDARRSLREALVLAGLLVVPLSLLSLASLQILPWLSLGPEAMQSARWYLIGRLPGLAPLMAYAALRGYLQALSLGRPVMISTLIALLANVPLSIGLAWGGRLGGAWPSWLAQGWGAAGVAIASSLVTFLQMGILLWVVSRLEVPVEKKAAPFEKKAAPVEKKRFSWGGVRALWWLGWPIALQTLAEVGLFVMTTLLMGRFGEILLSGHKIALDMVGLTFTVCLGVGHATSVRVGYAIGRHDHVAARRAGRIGALLGGGTMGVSALFMTTFGPQLAGLFSRDARVIQATASFLLIAALFQLVDGIQVVMSGALRGAGDTRTPLIMNVAAHWLVGIPLGAVLAFATPVGAWGLWWGLCAGLGTVSVLLSWRFLRVTRAALSPSLRQEP